jgi:predicted Rossmann fold flavoprotein
MSNSSSLYDVIIIGAGAAGLMTAVGCRQHKLKVLLLDSRPKIGAKILMSGGTRCNVTNQEITAKDYQSQTPRHVEHILKSFSVKQTLEFFKKLGVQLVLEPSGKYFPTTNSGKTVLEAFLKELDRQGVELRTSCKVTQVVFKNNQFFVQSSTDSFSGRCVVLTTGGLSYPTTGSDGSGYKLARQFGHTLVATSPSLTPLKTEDADWKSVSGISIPCRLLLYVGNKKQRAVDGDFLFTHFGFSGPSVLDMSRHWIRQERGEPKNLKINFLPQWDESQLREQILMYTNKFPKRQVKSFLEQFLPKALVEILLRKLGIKSESLLSQLKKEEREVFIRGCGAYDLPISGDAGYAKAEVTAGGVDLKNVNPKTMESTLQSGLFFAGEILDVDGRIGGFNFQWAWASGHLAASAIAEKITPSG